MDAKANKGKHLTLEDRITILNNLIKEKRRRWTIFNDIPFSFFKSNDWFPNIK